MANYTSVKRNDKGKLIYTYDRERNNKYRRGSFVAHKVAGSKRNAKNKGLDHTITTEYMKQLFKQQEGLCALSGLKMENIGDGYFSPSIDRIDPTKGYIEDNVQWVLWRVNDAKSNMDNASFIYLCKRIAEYNQ